ncbi:MAG: 3-hydroxybutyryl-CoA dehydrogenase [Planctomycetota bacterium]|nr:MAG: 3-hydroxybutyryl-CoA dehydrogenase [Planctomycetota bacterium]
MAIKKVGIVGCGLMGHGIAQVAAQAGMDVVVRETEQGALDKGLGRVSKSLAKLVEKEKIDQASADAAAARLTGTLELADLADCDLVVEAIIEDLAIKKALYAELGKICKPETILASNTSSFPVAEMGAASGRPERMVGLHFFNPVQLMKLVEVVRTPDTADDVFAEARSFGEAVGKVPVGASDTPGFIVNRLLVPYMAEAMRMVERGDATVEDVDTAMKLGCGYPMGPFTLTDYVGLDTTLSILQGWHERYPDDALLTPPKILEEKVAAGKLGRKTGEGFYDWKGDKRA